MKIAQTEYDIAMQKDKTVWNKPLCNWTEGFKFQVKDLLEVFILTIWFVKINK